MINSRLFSYNKSTKTFTAEISELGPNPFHRIDGVMGVTMISHLTGIDADFCINNLKVGDDGIESWTLAPTRRTVRRIPQLSGSTIIIFND